MASTDMIWSLSYSNGSNDHLALWLPAGAAEARYVWSPVTPLHSSSGIYSGGAPGRGPVPLALAESIWRAALALADDASLHFPRREKGTGALALRDAGGERQIILRRGAELAAFEAIWASLRS